MPPIVSAPTGVASIGIYKIYHPLGELPVASVAKELNTRTASRPQAPRPSKKSRKRMDNPQDSFNCTCHMTTSSRSSSSREPGNQASTLAFSRQIHGSWAGDTMMLPHPTTASITASARTSASAIQSSRNVSRKRESIPSHSSTRRARCRSTASGTAERGAGTRSRGSSRRGSGSAAAGHFVSRASNPSLTRRRPPTSAATASSCPTTRDAKLTALSLAWMRWKTSSVPSETRRTSCTTAACAGQLKW